MTIRPTTPPRRPGARPPARRRTLALLAALLSACAGGQHPTAGGEAAAGAEAGEAGARGAGPGAGATAAATAETLRQARADFADGARHEAAGDLAGALVAFERAVRSGADLPWAAADEGLVLERLGDEARARDVYLRALTAHPGFVPVAQNLVRLAARRGELPAVERELRERLAKGDGAGLRVGLAEIALAQGNADAAEEACRLALRADERNVPAMVTLATAYARKGRYELAHMVLENARQIDGSDPTVWNRLGFVDRALGNRAQAIDDFRTAASLRPDYPEAHANYGALLAEADDFAGAEKELELAVKYAPRSAPAWLDLGNARRGLLRFDGAEQAYRRALELDPTLDQANFDLAILYLDGDRPGLPALDRLQRSLAFFDAYAAKGGADPRVAVYRKDAARAIDQERKRLAREEKDRVRREAEARRKAAAAPGGDAPAAPAGAGAATAPAGGGPAAPAGAGPAAKPAPAAPPPAGKLGGERSDR